MYKDKFKIEESKLMRRLWGDNFYSNKEKKWMKEEKDGAVRGFTNYILAPIYQVNKILKFIFLMSICRKK